MGVLDVGDKLPTVKEVVTEVAVNPNTVMKAYWQLEHEGLVEGRQGVGTFVSRRPSGPPPDTQARLARSLEQWVKTAKGRALTTSPSSPCSRHPLQCKRGEDGVSTAFAIRTSGLGKRYGSNWALQDCSVSVPPGHVTALVGPNGAGKTTLLKLLVGLCAPSAGEAEVLGRAPEQTEEFLASIGYLAQDVPLYKRLSADDHLKIGMHLNLDWDSDSARERLAALKIPMDRPVATLSGGQRAQVGLSLVLAKRPRLLLLDEPMAALDPFAAPRVLGVPHRSRCGRGPFGRRLVASTARPRARLRPLDPPQRFANAALRHDRRVARCTSQPGRSTPWV